MKKASFFAELVFFLLRLIFEYTDRNFNSLKKKYKKGIFIAKTVIKKF